MSNTFVKPPFDLEQRTLIFSKNIRNFAKKVPRTLSNHEDLRQLIRSSGSVGANYREANDNLGRGDFLMKIRTSRKEAKESVYWLELLDLIPSPGLEAERKALRNEAFELMNIFGSILQKSLHKGDN